VLINYLKQATPASPSFIDKVKQRPFSVILLDEIEKADESVINIFPTNA
jgi:ATP-dependent Clp protease ATP-binding subunit ClpA